MISLTTAIAVYSVIGLVLLFDEDRAGPDDRPNLKDSPDPMQVPSPCGSRIYVLRPAEQAVALLDIRSRALLALVPLPFVPASITVSPHRNNVRVVAVGGPGAGELVMPVDEFDRGWVVGQEHARGQDPSAASPA
jgi:hypothetical protein